MTGDNGNLSIDFLVGFTIFLLAFIWVVSMIPGLLIGLQSYTIDSDAVAYRTGVILAEDPGEPALPLFPWETLSNKDVVRFGLAVSKNTPNILSRNKVDKFFCSSVFSYPDDYQQRVIFGDYPFRFNISFIEFGRNETRSVGDILSGNYGSIRRLVKIKEQSYATINSTKYMSGDLDNETLHEFSIVINNTELLNDKVRDPVYQINPAQEKITINITNLSSTLNTTRKDCFNINLTKIYAKDPAFVRIQLFTEPVIDGVPYHAINTEGMYATLPYVNNTISLTFDPSFIPWSNYPQVYLTLTFNLVKNASAPAYCSAYSGSRFLNNSLTSAFDYNYNPDNVKQPELIDGVLEVNTGSGYRTKSETLMTGLGAAFKYEIQTGAPTFTVKFTDQSTGSPVDWEWDFTNDGTVDNTLNNPTNPYGAPGIKTVKLTVKDASGLTSSTTGFVDLSMPVAGFSGTPVSGNSPLNVQFTDTSTGGAPSSWKWEYNKTSGGGWTQFNITQNPLNTFTVGNYDIRLTAANIFGPNTSTKYSYITVIPPAPVAIFTASPLSGNTPLNIAFIDASTNTPTSWKWEYQNATVLWTQFSTVQNPSISFPAGTYDIRLTATNAGGSNTVTKLSYITVNTVVAPPVANFTGIPTSGVLPLNVAFTDTSTNSPTSWLWNFGDSTTSTAQNPSHTYNGFGKYTVTLTATNSGGSNTLLKANYVNVCWGDTFNDNSLSGQWTTYGTGAIWSESGGVLSQTSTTTGDPKKATISNSGQTFGANHEITAKVRFNSWIAGDAARGGVSLFTDTADGRGYNLLFHNTQIRLEFLDDGTAWGTNYVYPSWSTGTWYWFKLKMDGNTLYGKVWQDGSTEPAAYAYSWARSGRTGYPALNGGSAGTGSATVSFDDVTVCPI